MSSIQELIENALKDPTLVSTLNIEKIVEASEDSNFLGKSMDTVTKNIVEILEELEVSSEKVIEFSGKLIGYQYIDRVCDIRLGRFIRWIKRPNSKNIDNVMNYTLHRGGILTSIDVNDSGIVLLCRNVNNRFFRMKWEDCVFFQQLSLEEKIILSLSEK